MENLMLPVRRSKVKKTLRGLAIVFVSYGLIGISPLAYTGAVGNPVTESNSGAAREPDEFVNGPKFLKFLYENRYMDLDQPWMVGDQPYGGVLRDFTNLEKETNTKIRRSAKGDWFVHHGKWKKVITIAGEDEDILNAFSRLMSKSTDVADIQIVFLVSASATGKLKGPDGENIQKIWKKRGGGCTLREVKSSAGIKIQDLYKLAESKVTVRGSLEQMKEVAGWIMSQLEDQEVRQSLTGTYLSGNSQKPAVIYIELTEKQTAMVRAKGGAALAKMKKEFLVNVEVDSEKHVLKIAGAIGDVHAAHGHVNSQILKNP